MIADQSIVSWLICPGFPRRGFYSSPDWHEHLPVFSYQSLGVICDARDLKVLSAGIWVTVGLDDAGLIWKLGPRRFSIFWTNVSTSFSVLHWIKLPPIFFIRDFEISETRGTWGFKLNQSLSFGVDNVRTTIDLRELQIHQSFFIEHVLCPSFQFFFHECFWQKWRPGLDVDRFIEIFGIQGT